MTARDVKTVRLRARRNTARLDRDVNRVIRREEKRGYRFLDLRYDRGSVHLVFAVPSRAASMRLR